MKENLVISLGGSLIFGEKPNLEFYHGIRRILKVYLDKYKIAIVCGGGKTAREYSKLANELRMTNEKQDLLGIDATRINARLIMFLLEDLSTRKVYTDIDELASDFGDKITICGGIIPGQRTDKVAALIAQKLQVKTLINMTNVDGVYNKDPNKFQDAKLIPRLNYDLFCELSGLKKHKPSYHFVFDFDAAEICHKEGIRVVIINGEKLINFENFLAKKSFTGSIIDF
ncbi:MAG: UMP kinase [Candidatus Helarchaeota archaeon]